MHVSLLYRHSVSLFVEFSETAFFYDFRAPCFLFSLRVNVACGCVRSSVPGEAALIAAPRLSR